MGGCSSHTQLLAYGGNNDNQKTSSARLGKDVGLLDFGANIAGLKKDQDRYIVVPEVCPGVLMAGIFDGHGGKGPSIPERAAASIPSLWMSEYKRRVVGGAPNVLSEEHSATMFKTVFEAFQAQHTQR